MASDSSFYTLSWQSLVIGQVGILLTVAGLVACTKTIEEGKFRTLKIGDTKAEVFRKLSSFDNVSTVEPAIENPILVKATSIERLPQLADSPGFVLRGQRFDVYAEIENGYIGAVTLAPVNDGQDFGIVPGLPVSAALAIVKTVMADDSKYQAFEFIPDRKWVKLESSEMAEGIAYLADFDCWAYHEDDRYSRTWLIFSDGRLTRIVYKWSLIEL